MTEHLVCDVWLPETIYRGSLSTTRERTLFTLSTLMASQFLPTSRIQLSIVPRFAVVLT